MYLCLLQEVCQSLPGGLLCANREMHLMDYSIRLILKVKFNKPISIYTNSIVFLVALVKSE